MDENDYKALARKIDSLGEMYLVLKKNISGFRFLDWQKKINDKLEKIESEFRRKTLNKEEIDERLWRQGSHLEELEVKVTELTHDVKLLKKGKGSIMEENIIVGSSLPNDDFTDAPHKAVILAWIKSDDRHSPKGLYVVCVEHRKEGGIELWLHEEGDTFGMPTTWVNPKGKWAPIAA